MEITTDYGAGSSGGPVLDKYGNLIGIVSATVPVGKDMKNSIGKDWYFQQMVIKQTIPVSALMSLCIAAQPE
jgi:serine protease Do